MNSAENRLLTMAVSTLLLAGAASVPAEVSAQSYCTASGCVVVGTRPGGSGGSGSGGWSGNSTDSNVNCSGPYGCPPDNVPFCEFLASIKPQNCPSPIPRPAGHNWAKDIVPGAVAWRKQFTLLITSPGFKKCREASHDRHFQT